MRRITVKHITNGKIKRTKVVDVLQRTDFGAVVNVKGWVRTHRSSKSVDFIALNDGSTIKNVQVVVDPSKFDESMLKQITTGSCINVNGELVESQGAGQTVELQCREIEIYGLCASDYPMQKKDRASSTCASMHICAFVPTPSEP